MSSGFADLTTTNPVEVTQQAGQPGDVEIEADELGALDSDSAVGEDAKSFTTSLKSSITNYQFENGRRYHAYKEGSYFLPNDEDESDRLDLFHHLLTMTMDGKLHLAPIGPNPQRILDLGTGTGIWAIEMGEDCSSAEVLGNDLSPIQPSLIPPNVRFEVDDMENDWVYGSKFDYVHARYLCGAIKDWPRLVKQAFENTKPGGWVEFQDFTMTFYTFTGRYTSNSAIYTWLRELISGLRSIGREPEPGPLLEGWFKEAGFANIHQRVFPIPLGTWPKDQKMKEIGAFNLVHFLEGLEAFSLRMIVQIRGWSPAELQVLLAKVRKELKNPKMQMQHNFHVVYGQRPDVSGSGAFD